MTFTGSATLTGPALRLGAFLLVAMLLAACTSSSNVGSTGSVHAVAGQLPPPEILAAIPDASSAEYRVGPADVLDVSVFQVEDLSRTVQVSASGHITLPLIGTVPAGGKTVSELETHIAHMLGEKYLQHPQVSVLVKEANSQRVTVSGAVKNPGMVTLTGPTTLLQTVALSGGLTPEATASGVLVFRTVGRQRTAAKFDLAQIGAGKAKDPVLHGGDVVVVDKSGLKSAWAGLRSGIPVVGLFTALSAL